jgi:hypothetical protein
MPEMEVRQSITLKAGTIFFQFVIAELIYAEDQQLKPWVFFNNI